MGGPKRTSVSGRRLSQVEKKRALLFECAQFVSRRPLTNGAGRKCSRVASSPLEWLNSFLLSERATDRLAPETDSSQRLTSEARDSRRCTSACIWREREMASQRGLCATGGSSFFVLCSGSAALFCRGFVLAARSLVAGPLAIGSSSHAHTHTPHTVSRMQPRTPIAHWRDKLLPSTGFPLAIWASSFPATRTAKQNSNRTHRD